jgi:hypothetical protein
MTQPRRATDQEIQKWVFDRHGFMPEAAWIADCKQQCGIPVEDVRAFQHARFTPCPPQKRPAIKQALRHFGMLPPEP